MATVSVMPLRRFIAPVATALVAFGVALSPPLSEAPMSAPRVVKGGMPVALELAPVDRSRARRGNVMLLLAVARYQPATRGAVQIVVRRRDTSLPQVLERIAVFPAGAFPNAREAGGRTFRVPVGVCGQAGDWACDPKLEVVLDAGPGGSVEGAEVVLGVSRLEID